MRELSDPPGRRVDNALSPRETDVLRLLAEGMRIRDIAETLIVSERTVGNHVTSIYNKFGVNDRAAAIVYAIKHGLVRV
jgi:DNA-binding NarL/FixJ family response regulator